MTMVLPVLVKSFIQPRYFLYLAWIQALIATMGSLYFSEIMKLPPCVLCWYQRIAMYPLALLIPIGIARKDTNMPYYVLSLALVGLGISIYHNLLYWKILPESAAPCVEGVSCTTKFFEWFGFITIPLLALVAFIVVVSCMMIALKLEKKHQK